MTFVRFASMRRMPFVLLVSVALAIAATPASAQVTQASPPAFDGRAGVARIDKARIDASRRVSQSPSLAG